MLLSTVYLRNRNYSSSQSCFMKLLLLFLTFCVWEEREMVHLDHWEICWECRFLNYHQSRQKIFCALDSCYFWCFCFWCLLLSSQVFNREWSYIKLYLMAKRVRLYFKYVIIPQKEWKIIFPAFSKTSTRHRSSPYNRWRRICLRTTIDKVTVSKIWTKLKMSLT